jgi:2'-5' RNA ligase
MHDWAEWQKAYLNGVVLIWPPADIRSTINSLRARYDPVSHSYCEAHISLTTPFVRAPSRNDWRAVQEAAAEFAPFDISIGPISSWLGQSVIYLEVRPYDHLEKLREALLATKLFASSPFKEFVPHMTITEGLSGLPVSEQLVAELQNTVKGGSFRCDHLTYVQPDQHFHFKVERLIELSKLATSNEPHSRKER